MGAGAQLEKQPEASATGPGPVTVKRAVLRLFEMEGSRHVQRSHVRADLRPALHSRTKVALDAKALLNKLYKMDMTENSCRQTPLRTPERGLFSMFP